MVGLVLALAPAIVLLVLIYSVDKAEKEPFGLVLACVAMGALAVFPILVLEMALDEVFLDLFDGGLLGLIVQVAIGVALVEELFKYWAARRVVWKNPQFNYVFDGIVYCAAAAIGYAAIENVAYVCFSDDMLTTALVRAFMSVPSHMVDGIFMGAFVGFAKLAFCKGDKGKAKMLTVMAILAPMIEHTAFDVLAEIGSDGSESILLAMVVVEYIIAFVIVLKLRGKNDIAIPVASAPEGGQTLVAGTTVDSLPQYGSGSAAFTLASDGDLADRHVPPASAVSGRPAGWSCSCGSYNDGNFCPNCGRPRP